jgi:SAM-dependent methyltransferase
VTEASAVAEQVRVNAELWGGGEHVATYANRTLLPVEVVILVRYREALSGRVLEVGCGAGRLLGYLTALGGEVHGIDISPSMVDYCRQRYPEAQVKVGDLGALAEAVQGPFDAVLAADNVLDIFDDSARRRALQAARELIAPGGLLIFSTHNLADLDGEGDRGGLAVSRGGGLVAKIADRPVGELVRLATRLPRRVRNRRRLAPLQQRGADHAIVNDAAHDYGLLHYYIRREDEARQLGELGFELVECLDPDGRTVGAGEPARGPWLHYVARAS